MTTDELVLAGRQRVEDLMAQQQRHLTLADLHRSDPDLVMDARLHLDCAYRAGEDAQLVRDLLAAVTAQQARVVALQTMCQLTEGRLEIVTRERNAAVGAQR